VILGCGGTTLSPDERSFFREFNPLGLILFQRNCAGADQIRGLIDAFHDCVGRDDAPVLIDQEGGRVARLKPPQWPEHPAASRIGDLAKLDIEKGKRAAWLNARLLAATLYELGITVDCAPVLDVPVAGAHDVIGDRAYAHDPALVAALGRAACEGFIAGGITPVIKHIPGHGRAFADSHLELPVIDADAQVLEEKDFPPFRDISAGGFGAKLWAMAAHCVYTALDAENAASVSPGVVNDTIRGQIAFDGVLIADDIGMQALDGGFDARAKATLDAGCDLTLHCSGKIDEMRVLADAVQPLSAEAARRVASAEQARRDAVAGLAEDADYSALRSEFDVLMGIDAAA